MEKVKIQFKNWYKGFCPEELGPIFMHNRYLYENGIELELSNKPDFVIYGTYYDFLFDAAIDSESVVKILIITEPIFADFMFFDYCMGFEPYDYGGRNCYYPDFIYSPYTDIKEISFDEAKSVVAKKCVFCDFIYSHDGIELSRKHYFDLFSSYKRVESYGTYLNNQKGNRIYNYSLTDNSKIEVQKKSKFSICIQSIDVDWFINEKIVHAIRANTIPIVYGTNRIKEIFNPKRIIFIKDFESDELLLKRIIDIDNNDDLFCSIISEPTFLVDNFQTKTIDFACKFVYEILTGKKSKVLVDKCKYKTLRNSLYNKKTSYDTLEKHKLLKRFLIKKRGDI